MILAVNVKPDPMTVLGVLAGLSFLGILIAAIVIGERCPKCRAKADEVRHKDPLEFRLGRVRGIPRIMTAWYRCPACGHEFERRHLTG